MMSSNKIRHKQRLQSKVDRREDFICTEWKRCCPRERTDQKHRLRQSYSVWVRLSGQHEHKTSQQRKKNKQQASWKNRSYEVINSSMVHTSDFREFVAFSSFLTPSLIVASIRTKLSFFQHREKKHVWLQNNSLILLNNFSGALYFLTESFRMTSNTAKLFDSSLCRKQD